MRVCRPGGARLSPARFAGRERLRGRGGFGSRCAGVSCRHRHGNGSSRDGGGTDPRRGGDWKHASRSPRGGVWRSGADSLRRHALSPRHRASRAGTRTRRAFVTEKETPMAEPVVGILMGSESDKPRMAGASEVLTELGVPHEVLVLSAHRAPAEVGAYAEAAV